VRWPFELFQNALDAGPRPDKLLVDITISRRGSNLLSGGSNKELESEDTTGRFGTGYLVTHVLSEKVHLVGLLQVGTGVERFDLNLDRSGDEAAILQNMRGCSDAFKAAKAIPDYQGLKSASLAVFRG
jgi:hypothetical protein